MYTTFIAGTFSPERAANLLAAALIINLEPKTFLPRQKIDGTKIRVVKGSRGLSIPINSASDLERLHIAEEGIADMLATRT
jgi:hypothetical protein